MGTQTRELIPIFLKKLQFEMTLGLDGKLQK